MRCIAAAVVMLFLVVVPSAGAWTWPVAGPVLAPFSFDPAHPYAGGEHRGVDIGADAGAAVVAPVAGTVTFAGTVPTSGKSLSILTADSLSVTLTHLGALAVAKGASVDEGSPVGTVGPSGTPELSVPYVHLGVRRADDDTGYLDPLGFLPSLAPVAPPAPSPAPAAAPPPEPAAPPVDATPAAPPPPVETAPPDAPPVETMPVVAPPAAASPPVTAPAPPGEAPPVKAPAPAPTAVAPPAPASPPVEAPPVTAPAPAPTAVAPPAPAFDPAAPTTLPDPADATPPRLAEPAAVSPAAAAAPGPAALGPAAPGPAALGQADPGPADPGPADPGPADPVAARAGLLAVVVRRADAVGRAPHTDAPGSRPAPAASVARAAVHHELPAAAVATARRHRRTPPAFVLAGLAAAALAGALTLARIISTPSATPEGASPVREDPRCAGVAVCERPAAHRPRGGLRRAGGRLRALPPAEGRRGPHGERHGRARDAGHGVGRSRGRVSA
jgi:hypothetical protein